MTVNKLGTLAEVKGIVDAAEGRGTRMTVRLSRTSTDRDGEVIRASGWRVPTGTVNVLVNHDNRVECVVGKLIETHVDGDAYMGTIEYADNVPENTLARFVVAMHKSGQLGPVSVGFMPEKWIDPDGKTYTRQNPGPYWGSLPGREYVEQELLELSEVAVGSHRDAMVLVARAFGIEPGVSVMGNWIDSGTSTGSLANTVTWTYPQMGAAAPSQKGGTAGPGTSESTKALVATNDSAPTSGAPHEEIAIDWFQKFLGATAPKASDAVLSREQNERLNEAEAAVESAMKAFAALRSAMRAGEAT